MMTWHKLNKNIAHSSSLSSCLFPFSSSNLGTVGAFIFMTTSILISFPNHVLPFKAGHVEPVPRVYPPTGSPISSFGTNTTSSSSRAAILMKLTSARRGSVPLPYDSSMMTTAPAPTGFYSQSFESHEKEQRASSQQHRSTTRTPYVRYPSPFSSISSTIPSNEKQQHLHQRLHHYQRIQRQGTNRNTQRTSPKSSGTTGSNVLQREEPSSILTSVDALGGGNSGSYYTTGNDGAVGSTDPETTVRMVSLSKERYNSGSYHDEPSSNSNAVDNVDLYKKQSENSLNSVNASPSHNGGSNSLLATVSSSNRNGKSLKSSPIVNLDDKSLLPPTLLPPSYLSLATFRHIDGTLEKSSSNILSRIANFWKNLSKDVVASNNTNINDIIINNSNYMANRNKKDGGGSLESGSRKTNKNADGIRSRSISSPIPVVTNLKDSNAQAFYTKLSDSSSIDMEDEYDEADNVSLNNNNDDHNDNRNNNSSGNHQRHRHEEDARHGIRSSSGSILSGEKSESRRDGGSSLQPDTYISIEDINNSGDVHDDNNDATLLTAKQQYESLDDGFGSEGEENVLLKEDHHDNRHSKQNENGVKDFITNESSVGFDDFDVSSGGDSGSNTFLEDLFHHTTGTITAVVKKDQFHEDDLLGSGSSLHENGRKLDNSENTARSSANIGSSAGFGNVKKAESDKIWSMDSHFGRNDLIESAEDEEQEYYFGMTVGGFLKRELWTIPLFVLAALNMILIILFEVYVLCRARGQSRQHLFLGQMLLFGLFLCSFLALMFAVHPSIVGCFVGRLGVGITYSLIYAVLMVKCVFLLSLDSGVYLPTSYQGMLLFFAVAVQVAVDTQWVIMYPPFLQTVESGRSVLLQCGTSFIQLLYSLSYVGFLVVVVGFLAGRAAYKGVVENYRESVYILITAVVTVPVALSWTVAGWMLQGRHQDACVSFGLVAHSLTTFLIMFMPKGRQLASLDKEAVCFEDQEDQCSGYSPSFFHFKPSTKNYKTTLWGDGNLYTTLEPTVSTINPNVFFHRNDFHSGMIY